MLVQFSVRSVRNKCQKDELLEKYRSQKAANSSALGKPLSYLYVVILCESSMLLFLALPEG